MKKTSLSIITILLSTISCFASWQLPIENYSPQAYNAGTQNWQIRQQKNGWMYFANNYGLLEYDGYQWQLYGIWNSTVIRSIQIAKNGEIYVGGTNEYGKFFANAQGKLTYKPLSLNIPDAYKNFGEVWNINLLDSDLYIQTRNYIIKQSPDNKISIIEPSEHIFCSSIIHHSLFIATESGIYLLSGGQLNGLRGSDLLKGMEIRGLAPYKKNSMLIATDLNGFYIYDGYSIKPFKTDADNFIKKNQLYTFAVGKHKIAIGTVLNGVAITDISGKNFKKINAKNGLQNNTVLSLLFDNEDNLWMGLDQGITRIATSSPITTLYDNVDSKGSGYTSLIVGNTIYFGTNQGLFYTNYYGTPDSLDQLQLINNSLGQIWSLDTIGKTIFCSNNKGLYIVRDKQLIRLSEDEGFWRVRAFNKNKAYAIAGSYSGIYLLKKENDTWTVLRKIKGFDKTSRVFEIDSDDNIWIITDIGIEKLTLNLNLNSCIDQIVLRRFNPQEYFSINMIDNQIIISSTNRCLILKNNELEKDSAFFNQILEGTKFYYVIKKDNENNIWFLSDEGLKVKKYDRRARRYSKRTIKIHSKTELLIGGFEHLNVVNSHEAICGTISGFDLYNLDNELPINDLNQNIIIRKIRSSVNPDSIIYGESFPPISKKVVVNYNQNSLIFDIEGAFNTDDIKEYSYQLIPIEQTFSTWGNNHIKEYTALPDGEYQLKIRVRSSGTNQIQERTFKFNILPPWYRTWWANLFKIILIIGIAYLIYLYSKNKIERSKRKLAYKKDAEMREKEQTYLEEMHNREKEILELKNQQIENELKNKTQELGNMMLSHLNKNEILTEIKHDLIRISSDIKEKDKSNAMRKVVLLQNKITRNIEQDIDWKKFEENFDIVHDRFLQKLKIKFPELNPNEVKLCIYIKMGLITKEIAPLMNISTRGVEMLRYRMRKKMGLSRNDDLSNLFEEINNDSINTSTIK